MKKKTKQKHTEVVEDSGSVDLYVIKGNFNLHYHDFLADRLNV